MCGRGGDGGLYTWGWTSGAGDLGLDNWGWTSVAGQLGLDTCGWKSGAGHRCVSFQKVEPDNIVVLEFENSNGIGLQLFEKNLTC